MQAPRRANGLSGNAFAAVGLLSRVNPLIYQFKER